MLSEELQPTLGTIQLMSLAGGGCVAGAGGGPPGAPGGGGPGGGPLGKNGSTNCPNSGISSRVVF